MSLETHSLSNKPPASGHAANEMMYSVAIRMFIIAVSTFGTAALTYAQQNGSTGQSIDAGKDDYDSHCAACHGTRGAGDGPYARLLNVTVPDLTTLSKKNDGKFPYSQVSEIIDGRFELPAHGTRNMPIWGQEFVYRTSPRNRQPEALVRAKIRAIVFYVSHLQVK